MPGPEGGGCPVFTSSSPQVRHRDTGAGHGAAGMDASPGARDAPLPPWPQQQQEAPRSLAGSRPPVFVPEVSQDRALAMGSGGRSENTPCTSQAPPWVSAGGAGGRGKPRPLSRVRPGCGSRSGLSGGWRLAGRLRVFPGEWAQARRCLRNSAAQPLRPGRRISCQGVWFPSLKKSKTTCRPLLCLPGRLWRIPTQWSEGRRRAEPVLWEMLVGSQRARQARLLLGPGPGGVEP